MNSEDQILASTDLTVDKTPSVLGFCHINLTPCKSFITKGSPESSASTHPRVFFR